MQALEIRDKMHCPERLARGPRAHRMGSSALRTCKVVWKAQGSMWGSQPHGQVFEVGEATKSQRSGMAGKGHSGLHLQPLQSRPLQEGLTMLPTLCPKNSFLLNAGAPQLKSHFLQPCTNQPILAGLSGPDF